MILFDEAINAVLEEVPEMGTEKVPFDESLNRILAENIKSDMDMPPFDKSAMDGFACRLEDIDKELEIIEIIPAGKAPEKVIKSGQCAKIMTGAKVPKGANCVVKVEDSKLISENIVRFTVETTKTNIAYKGEDVKEGNIVLQKGILIKPQHIAVMASVGCVLSEVAEMVTVGIISTGDEIVEPFEKPSSSQIRNSNGHQLLAQVEDLNCVSNYYGIAADDEQLSFDIIVKALQENDLVLLTGGVSMGDFDFIPKVFERIGIELEFKTVAIQPGKPTVFGKYDDKRIFGLPGNPVSAFNTFDLFVRPLIMKMMGANKIFDLLKLPLGKTYKRRKAGRTSWMPVQIKEDGKVYPMEYHGSAHINSLVFADGFISIPLGKSIIEEGEIVDVRPI